MPSWNDPRLPVVVILFAYVVTGITLLGFNRAPEQIALIVISACSLDFIFHRLFKQQWLFPLSALITGLSLSILVNYAHGMWLPLVPVFFAIASKYLFTVDGRHIYNPALFGIVICLLFADKMISVSPAYQWSGIPAMAAVVVTAAVLLFVLRIKRSTLVLSFLGFYVLALFLRAWLMRHHIPPETLIIGSLTAPSFYLFVFFMITDPATSPESRKGQVLMAFFIVVIDLYLHTMQALSTLFYAGFIVYSLRFLWLQYSKWIKNSQSHTGSIKAAFKGQMKRFVTITLLGSSAVWAYGEKISKNDDQLPGFYLTLISSSNAGISSHPSDVLEKVDPRLQHVAKWLLSVGDAVAVADFDNDGLQDIFLTYPLKAGNDRAALYKNMGEFQFERVALPALTSIVESPEKYGLPASALWFDADNDGDQDLYIGIGYGMPILLHNQLQQTGKAGFINVSEENQLTEFSISLAANVFDFDRDGWLDIYMGNAMNPWLPDYDEVTPFTIFDLPKPAYEDDRRMLNVMHRSWHNARNGGEDRLFRNNQGILEKQDLSGLGISNTGWTLDIGTGDLNNDGWIDLYLANDFGPDKLYINQQGSNFKSVEGQLRGSLGRDTYKGMNASIADLDGNGAMDIYVSNVHEPLQAEGSMLWLNSGKVDLEGPDAFEDVASELNALNPHRFGWGGAVGDLDRDGRLDILQANGMVDNAYENKDGDLACQDYWYWNARIALTGPDIHGYADNWADLRGRCIFPFEQNRVMLNRGQYFVDVASQVGWERKDNARGIALADLDNDGDLDVLMTHQFAPVSIFKNDAEPKSWLGLDLSGDGVSCNRDATGSRVTIKYHYEGEEILQYREVVASNGFSSQNDHRLLFGLANYSGPINVEIDWCGKQHQKLVLEPMYYYSVTELETYQQEYIQL